MWVGNWQRKIPVLSLSCEASSGERVEPLLSACLVHGEHLQLGSEATRETALSLLLPSDPPFTQRKKGGLNGWTFPKQEYWEITRSNHALKIWSERATQCSRKKWTLESCQYSETHLLRPFKDQPNAHTCSMRPFVGPGRNIMKMFHFSKVHEFMALRMPLRINSRDWEGGKEKLLLLDVVSVSFA